MRSLLTRLFSLFLMLTGPTVVAAGPTPQSGATAFEFEGIDGKPLPLSAYAGKVVLVVNTASFCGYTRQYKALQALWEKYEGEGLVIVGVPSNDFGGQEPKAEAEIKTFCEGAYGITFPLTGKTVVAGKDAHPFYAFAREALGAASAPRWNFHKYLIGRDGKLVAAFGTPVEPDAAQFVAAITAELAKQQPRS